MDQKPLTDEELAEIAKPSEADIERAKVFWRSNAKAEAKEILDATTAK